VDTRKPQRLRPRGYHSPALNREPLSELDIRVAGEPTGDERSAREQIHDLFEACPIPKEELLQNLQLFINRQEMTRLVYLNDLYRSILDVNGIVMEFGVRWGRDLALFASLRGMYEPFNYTRKILGFDTFEGFPSIHDKDGAAEITSVGAYKVTEGYDEYLRAVLNYHEHESPISHIKKCEIFKGDATETVPRYLEENPATIVALAYFDFDIYEPTRVCLEAIRPHLTKGSVVAFDELNSPEFPGETQALKEVLGLDAHRIRRSPHGSYPSWLVIE
jgi:hypothetical protein